jgi:AAHS family 4-hydroxybenzoate transporter-like MFS transporter
MKNRTTTLILSAFVMLIDGYDLSAMPLAVPHLAKQFGIPPEQFTLPLMAVLVGLGAGALLIAPIGDRRGRRPTTIIATAVMAAATLGTAYGTSVWSFALWRFLTGLGLGVCLPNVTSLVSEMAPPGRRAGVLTIVSCAISVGGVGAGLVAPYLVALGGWQALFVLPAAFTVLLTALMLFALAESPKLGEARDAPPASLFAPLQSQYLRATMVFVGVYAINALALYMLTSWLPTLLPRAGFSIAAAARMSSAVQFGGLVGALVLSLFLDSSRKVAALGGAYLLVVLALVGFSILPAEIAIWSVLLFVVGAGISGSLVAIMAVGTGFYPARMTSSAIGVAVAVARVTAIAGQFVGGKLIGAGFGPGPYCLALIVPVLICAGGVLMIPKVRAPV